MIFSKEEQTIIRFWRFFYPETKKKLENNSLMFSNGRVVLKATQAVFLGVL